jgi:hypothetical protein
LSNIFLSLGTVQRCFGKDEAELKAKLEAIKDILRYKATNFRETIWFIQSNCDLFSEFLEKTNTYE